MVGIHARSYGTLFLTLRSFEEIEEVQIAALDDFYREELQFDFFSIEGKKVVKGQSRALIDSIVFDTNNLKNYDALYLPRGEEHQLLLEDDFVFQLVKSYYSEGKVLIAICAAATVLQKAEVLKDKNFTSYPGYAKSDKNTGEPVEIANNLVTGRDFGATIVFTKEVVKKLKN